MEEIRNRHVNYLLTPPLNTKQTNPTTSKAQSEMTKP